MNFVLIWIMSLASILVFLVSIKDFFIPFKSQKKAYDEGWEAAKNQYLNYWRHQFETARLKLVENEFDQKNQIVSLTMYLKKIEYKEKL